MNRLLKNMMTITLSLSILSVGSSFNVSADTVNYVAFGDSISYGYGLENPDTENYVNILADHLNANTDNYSINGITSAELITMLDTGEYDDQITNADVITISIGSNDILQPFMQVVADTIGVEYSENISQDLLTWYQNADMVELLTAINNLNTVLPNNQTILDACNNFAQNNFPTIISDIKQLNPDCEILVDNIYNPYYGCNISGALDLGTISDAYVQQINLAFDTSSTEYTVVNLYDTFNTTGLTNVDVTNLNLDPHPNKIGHSAIASQCISLCKTEPGDNNGKTDVPGDVNQDGKVSTADLIALKKYLLAKVDVTDADLVHYDVNQDGKVSTADLIQLKKKLLGV